MGKVARQNAARKANGEIVDEMKYGAQVRASMFDSPFEHMAVIHHQYDLRRQAIPYAIADGMAIALQAYEGKVIRVLVNPQTYDEPQPRHGKIELPVDAKLTWSEEVGHNVANTVKLIMEVQPHAWGSIEISANGDDRIERHIKHVS